jgi:hypothetical protein
MFTKKLLAGAVAGAATLTLIGGCAAKEIQALEPKLELRNAAQQLAGAQQAGFTIKLSGTPDALVAAIKAQSKDDFTADDEASVRKLVNSSVTVAYDKGGAGTEDDKSAITATVDGVTGTEIRAVAGVLYAKVPVADLATKFGATPADVKALTGQATGQATGQVPGLSALFDGKWVSLDSKELTDLAAGGAAAGVPSAGPEQQEKVMKELSTSANNLLQGASVVRDSADSKHLIVTSSTAKAYAEGQRLSSTVLGELGTELPKQPVPPKDRPIVLDLWVDNGKFTAAEVNVLQFVDGATGRVAVRIDVTPGAPIAAPDGATKIDTKGLIGSLAGLSSTPA